MPSYVRPGIRKCAKNRALSIRCLLLLMTTTKCWGVKLPYVYWMRLRGILTMVWSVCR